MLQAVVVSNIYIVMYQRDYRIVPKEFFVDFFCKFRVLPASPAGAACYPHHIFLHIAPNGAKRKWRLFFSADMSLRWSLKSPELFEPSIPQRPSPIFNKPLKLAIISTPNFAVNPFCKQPLYNYIRSTKQAYTCHSTRVT